jgi:hypothetical protein
MKVSMSSLEDVREIGFEAEGFEAEGIETEGFETEGTTVSNNFGYTPFNFLLPSRVPPN